MIEFVVVDIEATGMDPARHEIIEVGIVAGRTGTETEANAWQSDSWSSLVRPTRKIALDTERLTGITNDELADAPSVADLTDLIGRKLDHRWIVGHSVHYDLGMLAAVGVESSATVIDTFQLATALLPNLSNYSLATVAVALGLTVGDNHRALHDAQVNAMVFRALVERLEAYDLVTLAQVAALARLAEWESAPLFEEIARSDRIQSSAVARRSPHELAFLTPRDKPEPLRSKGTTKPIDTAAIRAALQPGGTLSRVVPGYEHRPQQEAMAVAVAEALNDDHHLVAEAGTGTGKSFAYLLPAALHAAANNDPVVISTATLALQDQLYRKDIPDLTRALAGFTGMGIADGESGDEPFKAVVLKGRSNYLCLRRWFSGQQTPILEPEEASLRAKINLWLGDTATGDRAELRLDANEEAGWNQYAEEEHACVPGRCVYQQRNQCFLFRARREAEAAKLIVVNHALLLSDAVTGSGVIPDHSRLIIDEAHHLEDQATMQFGFSVSERGIAQYLDAVMRTEGPIQVGAVMGVASFLSNPACSTTDAGRQRAGAAVERARQVLARTESGRTAAHVLFRQLRTVSNQADRKRATERSLRLTEDVRERYEWLEVLDQWTVLDQSLREIEGHLRRLRESLEAVEPQADASEEAINAYDIVAADLVRTERSGADLADQLGEIVAKPSADQVYWIERTQTIEAVSLHAAPLRVGGVLRDRVFDRLSTAVLTSATVTTDGTFDYVADRLGIYDASELMVASPFDYGKSAMLYLSDDMPEPNQSGYQQQLQDTLVETCRATNGRALVLFTSYAALQATYRAIKEPLESSGIVVLAQRTDGSPRQLIDRLKHGSRVVVLGTASFWEGVDVVGPALSLLVITKLPFSVPTDPVFAARGEMISESGGDAFLEFAVPQAVLKFKQGFGRLIRSGQDRGVCAVLDRRIVSKRYGHSFVDSLPDCSVVVGSSWELPAAAHDWLTHDGQRTL